ncbi:MAG: hypothetical protein ABSF64_30735 [Bryobacteraceae bacterium]|jgi:hypothetical protein
MPKRIERPTIAAAGDLPERFAEAMGRVNAVAPIRNLKLAPSVEDGLAANLAFETTC